MKRKIALIIGVSGQDGTYLAHLLLRKGYEVWGSSRDAQGNSFRNLKLLGIKSEIRLISIDPEDFRSVLLGLKNSKPEEVYFLAGQSSVGLSFEQAAETIQSQTFGLLNTLEAVKFLQAPIRVFNSGSSEAFGDTLGISATEKTAFRPKSPYGLAKASSYWLVDNYREAYEIYACTGMLFNHESPLRPNRFVTQKIIQSAKQIAAGKKEKIYLGRVDIYRDWGWAPEYVNVMWEMLQLDYPEDFLIATGESNSLEDFVDYTFKCLGLSWREYVLGDQSLFRPADISQSLANPEKAKKRLNWKARNKMKQVIELMLESEFHN
ncbi:MAG: GDP-mannose 4,6-dehydratase [Cyclobacteriaceae bacterium]|nr:GDP-mannose 4,6-dehydratase [Cyclobacteriaceae bacterium]